MKLPSMLFAALLCLGALSGCTASNQEKNLGEQGYRSGEAAQELRDRLRYQSSYR